MLYTHILGPVFYWKVIQNKRRTFFFPFFAFLFFYAIIHLFQGVDIKSFFVSNALLILTFLGAVGMYHFFASYRHLGKIFRQLLLFNAFMVVLSMPFLFMDEPYQDWFWYVNRLTNGITDFPRLAMFTYEASYYSLLFVPVLFFYLLKFSFNQLIYNRWLTLGLVLAPIILSMSFGVIGAAILTAIIMCIVWFRRLIRYKRAFIFFIICVLLAAVITGILFYIPNNPVVVRLGNIFKGNDTSANGRTIESFTVAWRIARERSLIFGAGLGQVKIIIPEMVGRYYNYWGNLPRYDIPNAMGEMLAIFGFFGVALKLGLETWLFFKTRVFTNYYRTALFIFIFIYQFTGSFITNIAEYVIWALAFAPVFGQFNINPLPPRQKTESTGSQNRHPTSGFFS